MGLRTNVALYSVGNLVVALVPFILIPFMTNVFDPETYGLITMFQVIVGLLSIVVGLSMNGPLLRFNYNKNLTEKGIVNYFYNSWLIYIVSVLLVLFMIYLYGARIANFIEIQERLIWLSLIAATLYYPIKILLGQLQVKEEAKKYVSIQLILSFMFILTFFAFYYLLYQDLRSRIYSYIFTIVPVCIFSIFLLRRYNCLNLGKYSFSTVKDILLQSVGILPHLLGVYIISFVDRFIANKYLGTEAVGILMLSIQISLVLNIIFDGINKALNPRLFRALRDDDYTEKLLFARGTLVLVILLILCSVPFSYISSKLILLFTDSSYHYAAEIVKYSIVTQLINGIYLAFVNYIVYSKKLWLLSVVSIITGVGAAVLSVIYVEQYGLVAIVYSSMLAAIIRTISAVVISTKLVKMPWNMVFKV
ncbi:lipopolysaccharide biosynthesis protein [Shewanella litorisediminis]|uniref:Oligosaccharide flippase family protein n=1 Tax=Shewanella litorisediminis TaxID=1173586 RepID=A0ABX7FZS8_9GAMM|nr:oligosaccharide flippase family protein [Shewanella litorisediminis]MCL2919639.1 oligosaccharide flippase family protein [Shewanella litorisediminis]QRH00530.1 oligosaccharide flippase family protein [Shewanella litorisediminis]